MRGENSTVLAFSDVDLSASIEDRLKLLEVLADATECFDHFALTYDPSFGHP